LSSTIKTGTKGAEQRMYGWPKKISTNVQNWAEKEAHAQ